MVYRFILTNFFKIRPDAITAHWLRGGPLRFGQHARPPHSERRPVPRREPRPVRVRDERCCGGTRVAEATREPLPPAALRGGESGVRDESGEECATLRPLPNVPIQQLLTPWHAAQSIQPGTRRRPDTIWSRPRRVRLAALFTERRRRWNRGQRLVAVALALWSLGVRRERLSDGRSGLRARGSLFSGAFNIASHSHANKASQQTEQS